MTKKRMIILSLIAVAIIAVIRFRPVISVGTCLNASGDGHIDASTDRVQEPYTYISYRGIAEAGERVVTLDIFNPFNNYCDDTILVADYNLETNKLSYRHPITIIITEG